MAYSTIYAAPPNVDAAISYFRECMLHPHHAKERHYRQLGMQGAPSASDADWIVLAALLTGDRAGGERTASELTQHHVRSHRLGSGPIYTLVREAVEVEFHALTTLPHLVFAHADNLSRVELWRLTGAQWAEYGEEFGGISHFAFSDFTDPEIDISPAWLFDNAELMLVIDAGRVTYLKSALTAD